MCESMRKSSKGWMSLRLGDAADEETGPVSVALVAMVGYRI